MMYPVWVACIILLMIGTVISIFSQQMIVFLICLFVLMLMLESVDTTVKDE